MLPASDEHGLLPPGIHGTTMEEIERRYGSFQNTSRRPRLFEKLEEFVEDVRKAIPGAQLLIDGSFVMGCVDTPSDIDLVLLLPTHWDMSAGVTPSEYNLISRKRVRAKYGFDVFPAIVGSDAERYWADFFQQ
ncbi:MAG: DUF6932 family protein, partial [Candidatus Hydrogenedentota bacterium]